MMKIFNCADRTNMLSITTHHNNKILGKISTMTFRLAMSVFKNIKNTHGGSWISSKYCLCSQIPLEQTHELELKGMKIEELKENVDKLDFKVWEEQEEYENVMFHKECMG